MDIEEKSTGKAKQLFSAAFRCNSLKLSIMRQKKQKKYHSGFKYTTLEKDGKIQAG